jgi:hypothetical protein
VERLALVEDQAFTAPLGPSGIDGSAGGSATAPLASSPRLGLRSVLRSADYLFLRYSLDASGQEGVA